MANERTSSALCLVHTANLRSIECAVQGYTYPDNSDSLKDWLRIDPPSDMLITKALCLLPWEWEAKVPETSVGSNC